MKNSTLIKGTAAIAVGAALLLGGGGTLANWNAEASATPGTIVSGDLNVENKVAGVWTDGLGKDITAQIDAGTYLVVPGDKLTFKQELAVTLSGNKMAAEITTDGIDETSGFLAKNVSVSEPVLTVGTAEIKNPLTPTGSTQTVTATITFDFLASTTERDSVNASYDFKDVAFKLTQVNSTGDGLS
jgi:alternate signal-mediated exported protein